MSIGPGAPMLSSGLPPALGCSVMGPYTKGTANFEYSSAVPEVTILWPAINPACVGGTGMSEGSALPEKESLRPLPKLGLGWPFRLGVGGEGKGMRLIPKWGGGCMSAVEGGGTPPSNG